MVVGSVKYVVMRDLRVKRGFVLYEKDMVVFFEKKV